MGLEAGTHINSLVATNPVGATDPKSQGDDHLRLIKSTILNTFPAITGAVTATHTAINQTSVGTGGTFPAINGSALTALNASALSSGTVADARLSANVPLLNAANTFIANQTITLGTAKQTLSATGATSATVSLLTNAVQRGFIGADGGTTTIGGPSAVATDLAIRVEAGRFLLSLDGSTSTNYIFASTLAASSFAGVAGSNFALLSAGNVFSNDQTIQKAAQTTLTISATTANDAYVGINTGGTPRGFLGFPGAAGGLIAGSAVGDLVLRVQTGGLIFSGDAGTTAHFKLSAAGILSTPNANAAEVGYKGLPQNSQSVSYTTVLADADKNLHQTGATKTFTIDDTMAYPIGTAINFTCDNATGVTITCSTAGNLHLGGTATTGARALAQYGMATALKTVAGQWIISGAGLS